jgi:phosphotransferase system HPr-like phosphotransfer protein
MRKKLGFWKPKELSEAWGIPEEVFQEALDNGSLEKEMRGFSEGSDSLSVRNFIYRLIADKELSISSKINHMEKVLGVLTIINFRGIHIGPSMEIVDRVRFYPKTKVEFWFKGESASGHKAIEILSLGLQCGDEVELICEGWGAPFLFNEIHMLFKSEFKDFYEKMKKL